MVDDDAQAGKELTINWFGWITQAMAMLLIFGLYQVFDGPAHERVLGPICDATARVLTLEQVMSANWDPYGSVTQAQANDQLACVRDDMFFTYCMPPGDTGLLICVAYAIHATESSEAVRWSAMDWRVEFEVDGKSRQVSPNPVYSQLAVGRAEELYPAMGDFEVLALMFDVPTSGFQPSRLIWEPRDRDEVRFWFNPLDGWLPESAFLTPGTGRDAVAAAASRAA